MAHRKPEMIVPETAWINTALHSSIQENEKASPDPLELMDSHVLGEIENLIKVEFEDDKVTETTSENVYDTHLTIENDFFEDVKTEDIVEHSILEVLNNERNVDKSNVHTPDVYKDPWLDPRLALKYKELLKMCKPLCIVLRDCANEIINLKHNKMQNTAIKRINASSAPISDTVIMVDDSGSEDEKPIKPIQTTLAKPASNKMSKETLKLQTNLVRDNWMDMCLKDLLKETIPVPKTRCHLTSRQKLEMAKLSIKHSVSNCSIDPGQSSTPHVTDKLKNICLKLVNDKVIAELSVQLRYFSIDELKILSKILSHAEKAISCFKTCNNSEFINDILENSVKTVLKEFRYYKEENFIVTSSIDPRPLIKFTKQEYNIPIKDKRANLEVLSKLNNRMRLSSLSIFTEVCSSRLRISEDVNIESIEL